MAHTCAFPLLTACGWLKVCGRCALAVGWQRAAHASRAVSAFMPCSKVHLLYSCGSFAGMSACQHTSLHQPVCPLLGPACKVVVQQCMQDSSLVVVVAPAGGMHVQSHGLLAVFTLSCVAFTASHAGSGCKHMRQVCWLGKPARLLNVGTTRCSSYTHMSCMHCYFCWCWIWGLAVSLKGRLHGLLQDSPCGPLLFVLSQPGGLYDAQ